MKEYLSSVDDVLADQAVDAEAGLSESEHAARLAKFGQNKLAEAKKDPLWKRFFAQMKDPMVIMLLVAAVISAAVSLYEGHGEFADVAIILFVVVLNSILGVVQESKAEEALAALQEMAAAQSKVIRDGVQIQVPSSELVPGDIVLIEAGDSIPADCRIIESASLKIEEAALTGESVPVDKNVDALTLAQDADEVPLGDRSNMCYMGSVCVYGRGRAVVVATGMKTEMGKIADAIAQAEDGETPLQQKLGQLSHMLTKLVVGICAIIFLTGFVKHGMSFLNDISLVLNTFMIAVSLAVAAIPEGLVAVVTIVLSIGVTRMSQRHAIIRKLTAVETLGCTQVICSDKTGTLTQNKMTVMERHASQEPMLLTAMALCSDASWDDALGQAQGEPTEAALVADAAKDGFTTSDLAKTYTRVGEAPFDSSRKMMSVLVEMAGEKNLTQFTKGAPDEIIKRCTHYLSESGVVELTDELRDKILSENKAMADQALRVIAAAMRSWGETEPENTEPATLEHDMVFIGLSGMIDPVRPEVLDAIKEAQAAGIKVNMITGDHIDTAVAIAKQLGIISSREQAITGADLDKMDDAELERRVQDLGVYARVQPEHKVRIVDTWRRLGMVTAMTGDGVNDAPSIKRADIGVGMGITGTDVTKNVADMVLADDNFATIISAVEEGRRIYDNIRKCIQFLLSSNLAEVISVFVASLVGFTILKPTHLLWINLITDALPALAMAVEPAEPNIMERAPRKSTDGIFSGGLGIDTLVQGIIISILTLFSYFLGHYFEFGTFDISQVLINPDAGREGMTMAFLTLSMVEMFHSFNMRSRRGSIFKLGSHNKWIWASFAMSLILTFVVIEVPFLADMFDFAELGIRDYAIAMGLAAIIVPIMELYKAIMRAIGSKDEA